MKSIILIALLCATALAVPSQRAGQKTNLVEILKEKAAPKLTQLLKITRANLYNLLEDNTKPGLREVVVQFFDSVEVIYNFVNRAADRLVPLFKKYNLNEVIQAELPQVVQKAAILTYEDIEYVIKVIEYYLDATPEDVVKVFIATGIYASTVSIPYYTYNELLNVIYGVSNAAGAEFYDIFYELVWDSADEGIKFAEVLVEAIEAAYSEH